jgi:hypothetical protein
VADDDQQVKSINVSLDGLHLKYVKTSGTHATLTFDSHLADNLPYGRHTLLARVVDGAKNVTNVTVVITRAKPKPVVTKLSLGVGRVRAGRTKVSGKIVAGSGGAPVGTVKIVFERRQDKRFKRVGSVTRAARRSFGFAYRLRGHGTWRVSARYVPKAGSAFKPSAAKPRLVKA